MRARLLTSVCALALAFVAAPAGADPDTTPPSISIITPAQGQHFVQGSSPPSKFSCSDAGGMDPADCVGPRKIDTAIPGGHDFTVTATDNAGNHATKTVTYVVDPNGPVGTPPVITINTPSEGEHFVQDTVVAPAFECTDPDGGSSTPACAGPASVDTATVGAHTFTVTSSDAAGNSSSKTVNYVVDATAAVVDPTRPSITVTTPAQGHHYAQNADVTAAYSCADNNRAGGIAGCTGPPKADTATPGTHSYVVTARDAAGNTATELVIYFVDPSPASIVAALRKTLRASSLTPDRSGSYRLSFDAPSAGALKITWRSGGLTIASRTATFNAAGNKSVRVRLRAAPRRRSIRVTVTASFTPASGATQRSSKSLTIRR